MRLKLVFANKEFDPVTYESWNGLIPPPSIGDTIKFKKATVRVLARTYTLSEELSCYVDTLELTVGVEG